jgi:hypothetical protein
MSNSAINDWVKTQADNAKKNLPQEGIPVVIKVGADYFVAHVVYSGGAEFHCLSPSESADEVSINKVDEWAYIECDLGIVEY